VIPSAGAAEQSAPDPKDFTLPGAGFGPRFFYKGGRNTFNSSELVSKAIAASIHPVGPKCRQHHQLMGATDRA